LVEIILPVVLVVSYIAWPYVGLDNLWSNTEIAAFGGWILLATGLLALAVYDLRWYLLPDKIVFPLTALGMVFVGLLVASYGDWDIARDAALGALVIFSIFYVLFQVSGGKWIGGGDVKLAVLLGILAGGFLEALLLLFIASVLGSIYGVAFSIIGGQKMSRKLRIPFGPFLIIAAFIVVLFGTDIVNWYSDLILSV